jgi:hypothetical protein
MAALDGVRIIANITPPDSLDIYPTHLAEFGKGGLRSVADIATRDAITPERREVGMMVYVVSEDKVYYLKTGITNTDWYEYTGGSPPVGALPD